MASRRSRCPRESGFVVCLIATRGCCQVAIYKETFDAFDVDGGGSIDAEELEILLNAFGVVRALYRPCAAVKLTAPLLAEQRPSPEELKKMILEVDEDGSGEIEFEEFLKMILIRMERNMMYDKEALRSAFDILDEDHDGEISSADLHAFLMNREGEEGVDGHYSISQEEAQDMIEAADRDNSGNVNFEEFWNFTTARMTADHEKDIARNTEAQSNYKTGS